MTATRIPPPRALRRLPRVPDADLDLAWLADLEDRGGRRSPADPTGERAVANVMRSQGKPTKAKAAA